MNSQYDATLIIITALYLLANISIGVGALVLAIKARFQYSFFKTSTILFGCGWIISRAYNYFLSHDARFSIFFNAVAGIVFYLALYAVLDAFQYPQRGLGNMWPYVARFAYSFHQFARQKSVEGEQISSLETANS